MAGIAAAALIFRCAIAALNEKQMAGVIRAVHVGVARRAALVAVCNYVLRDTLAHAPIEHEIFALKKQWQSFLLRTLCVFDYAAF